MALDAAAKRRIKNRKLAKSMANLEPVLDWQSKEDQDKGLGHALSWYSANSNSKDQKKYALEYFKGVDKSIYIRLKDLSDWRFGTFGSLCRMMSVENGYKAEWSTSTFFDKKLAELLAVYEKEKEQIEAKAKEDAKATVQKPKPLTIQQRIFNAASEIGGEFDEQIDIFTTTGNFASDFSAKKFLAEQGVSAAVAGRVAEFFVPVMEELSDAYDRKDEQLVEGYSHLTRTNLRRLRDFVKGLVEETQQFAQSAKKPVKRRPRAVIPAKVVARVKCQRKDESLGLVSIAPVKMLDTSEIWVYNTKYKKLQCYVSDGTPLSVKGTTIVGFDLKKSIQQTVRNPEKFFKGLSIGKRALSNAMKSIKTKASAPNGRLNENCIILGAF
jgi:hypothetical protein